MFLAPNAKRIAESPTEQFCTDGGHQKSEARSAPTPGRRQEQVHDNAD